MKLSNILVTLTVGLLSVVAMADDSKIELPEVLKTLEREGGTIHESFKVSEHLNGFAITVGVDQLIVYATVDGKHVINGSLLNEDAEDLTPGFADDYIPKPDYSAALDKLKSASYFQTHDKTANRQLYVFHDPNCGFCKKAWESVMQYRHLKGLEVRWMPVGALGKDSMIKASSLISSKEPVKLQNDFSVGYRLSQKEVSESSSSGQKAIENTRLMNFLRVTGTPAFVYVEDDKVVKIIKGFRRGEILDILGV